MKLSRREFINLSTRSTSGFVLGASLMSCNENSNKITAIPLPDPEGDFVQPFLKILEDGRKIIIAPVPEIGQGVRTSLPLLITEELNTSLDMFEILQGKATDQLGGMAAAGSDSIADYFDMLRNAGALVREMLIQAAKIHWNVDSGIEISNGEVIFKKEKLAWHHLIPYLKTLPIPGSVELKPRAFYTQIGHSIPRVDLDEIIMGKAQYGLDVRLKGMKYAVIARPPVYGGKVKSYNKDKALSISGVLDIIDMPAFVAGENLYAEVVGGLAIVADNTWAAMKGKKNLEISWDHGPNQKLSSLDLKKQPLKIVQTIREIDEEISDTAELTSIDANYFLAPLGHACMEPMNFTAHVTSEEATLIGPTQNPKFIQDYISGIFGLSKSNVSVTPTLVGGGFGRRLAIDYALEAAIISKKAELPIQLLWTREDDVVHDYFRTPAIHRVKASFDKRKLLLWEHQIYTQPIGKNGIYEVQGAADLPLQIPKMKVSWGRIQSAIRIGSWRSVAHSHNTFVVGSWLDEIAQALKVDSIDFILQTLGDQNDVTMIQLPFEGWRGNVPVHRGRLKHVISKVRSLSMWDEAPDLGQGLGFGFAVYKDSYAATIAHVEVDNKKVKIHKISSVLDCGFIVNPDGVKAQMSGSIMDAISTVFFNQITYRNGKIDQSNFHNMPWTRIVHVPKMNLEVVPSDENPRGAGEPPYPAVVPAITNAIFKASGIRIRNLPISNDGFSLIIN